MTTIHISRTAGLRRLAVRLLMCVAVLFALLPAARPVAAAPAAPLGDPNGPVRVTALNGTTLYIGGEFTAITPYTGRFAVLDAATEAPDLSFPIVNDSVFVIVPDGAGGWYITGSFTSVGGVARAGLAHIRADKTLDPAWNPSVNGSVNAMAVKGSTVYIAGFFNRVNGQTRNHLAALDATGALTAWNPNYDYSDTGINALLVNGNRVYVASNGYRYNGGTVEGLATFDATTGARISSAPTITGVSIGALALNGNTLYVGGDKTLTAFDVTTSAVTGWNPLVSDVRPGYGDFGYVSALAVSGNTVYVGGTFSSIGGQARENIAALDATTATVTAWDPDFLFNIGQSIRALVVNGSTVYVAGDFSRAGGEWRNGLAALDTSTGRATEWDPASSINNIYNQPVIAIATSGTNVAVGGSFTQVGKLARNRLAAFDTRTGELLSWNPGVNGNVFAVTLRNNLVYVGGDFTSVGGQPRSGLAALDPVSGEPTDWNPGASGNRVRAIVANSSTVYVAGENRPLNSVGTPVLKAISASTGATLWSTSTNEPVTTLVLRGNTLYVGGFFTQIGGKTRNGAAALNATTGIATTWNPNVSGYVNKLAVRGDTVYIGGGFSQVGGKARRHLAAVNTTTGNVTDWRPTFSTSVVNAVLVRGNTVFAGGASYISGEYPTLGVFDGTTAARYQNDYYLEEDNVVLDITADSTTFYVGTSGTIAAFERPDVPTTARTAPPAATQGADYAYTFGDSDDSTTAWRVTSGALPNGMTLHEDGTLSGTPTTSGTISFTIADANNPDTSETVTLTIATPTMTPRVYLPLAVR